MALSDHVYAHWKLNSVAGIIATDSSGNGRDGTLVNMEDPGDWVAGKLNNCLRFNEGSTNEYVDCGNIASFSESDTFSLEYWIKIVNHPTAGTRALFKYGSGKGYLSYITKNGIVQFLLFSSVGRIWIEGNTDVGDGNWHHIISTYDGSKSANGTKIYIDGVPETIHVIQNNLTGDMLNGASLRLSDNTFNYCLDGYLDEVVIYDIELNLPQVEFRYNGGSGRENFTAPPPTLLNPDPNDGATSIGYNQNLGWDSDGVKWDIYWGTGSPPPLVQLNHPTSAYTLPDLDSCCTYYWKIKAYNVLGGTTTGAEWSYTTGNELPVMPHDNFPVHNSTGQSLSLTLTWDSEDHNPNDTVVYDIYFGEGSNPPLVKNNHGSKSYNVSGLAYDKNYYWKIVAKDNAACGSHETTSPIWKFTTQELGLGGYTGFDVRQTIRSHFCLVEYKPGSELTEYYFEVEDELGDDIKIPMYLAEEVRSKDLKEMPFLDMGLTLTTFTPADIGAATRKKEAYVDISLYYTDTDNVDRTEFGQDIINKLLDYIRSHQCSFTNIDFINVKDVRLLRETQAHQVVYHWVITVYCIYWDNIP